MSDLLALEWVKVVRSRRPLIAVAVILLFLVLMLAGFYTYAQSETGGRAEFRYTFENSSYFNGLTFALYAYYFGALMILPVFAAAEGGAHLAGERHQGTLALLLARPVSRARIFATKLVLALATISALAAVLLLAALVLGLVLVGWGDLDLYPGIMQMTESHQHLPRGRALYAFLMAWMAVTAAMIAPLGMSFLLSAWIRNPVNVVASATAIYMVLYVVAEVHFFRLLRPYLYTSYMGYWRALFREQVDWWAFLADGAMLLGYGLAFLMLAFRRFRKRTDL